MKTLKFLSLLPFLLVAPMSSYGQPASNIDALLKAYFEEHPQADYDADGVLTKGEASRHQKMHAFIAKQGKLLKRMPEPRLAEYAYGPHWRNTLDFWKAESSDPTPVLLFFHPGGFVGGDKSQYYGDPLVKACLENGISVVLANYRYATQAPFPASHKDAARVIQTVRYHAKDWGIDPEKVAMTGSSAGGNMSVWLAVHDDLADPTSDDPIARESTRLTTIIGVNSQTSNDPFFIWENIYLGNDAHSSTYAFYGLELTDVETLKKELARPAYRKIAYEATALNHITSDDPPVFLIHPESLQDWNGQPLPADTAQSKYAHHIAFGKWFKDRYDAMGLISKLKGKEETTVAEQMDWLLKWFE
jgi:acetyl esterase